MKDTLINTDIGAGNAFNVLAKSYDDGFSHTALGRYYRQRVQQVMSRYWPAPGQLLELNAGTGEDALFLAGLGHQVLATDKSAAMLDIIRHKTGANNRQQITTREMAIEALPELSGRQFCGILSNFGGLNCVKNWHAMAEDTSKLLLPNGYYIMVVMGPWVLWEMIYFSLKGQFNKAFRRLGGSCRWRDMTIYYPSVRQIKKAMSPWFNLVESQALGLFMPPPYLNNRLESSPKLYRGLAYLEDKSKQCPGLWQLADHYLLVFQKYE
ncbi:class I SAM-dependent methyltransferase [Thalassomonas viridans]|uniref:Class I SAM-dependent methyltransferase n=1 Tax=Thalassomonas viridans TaxID=137584 RepID=A0AAF0CC76_9GAMM|nr:class I SAM-dependent methyltransferase [Thalassomonas viridans]WDE07906.1 class I SAM-dependent methyltransferase [Thalassomonas viridans]